MASVTDRKPELTLLRQPSAKDLVALFERISGRKATNGREAGIDGDCHRLLRRDAAVLTRAQCPPSHRRNRERSALFLLVRSRGCPGDIALNKPTAFARGRGTKAPAPHCGLDKMINQSCGAPRPCSAHSGRGPQRMSDQTTLAQVRPPPFRQSANPVR